MRQVIVLLRLETLYPPAGLDICDVGCGAGQWLVDLVSWGADPSRMAGIDLLESRLQTARGRLPAADLRAGDAAELPWPNESFDLVVQSTVFTSILEDDLRPARGLGDAAGAAARWADPVVRLLPEQSAQSERAGRRGGGDPRAVSRPPDRAAALDAAAPPLARLVVPVSHGLALALEKLPFLRTHYLGVIGGKNRL